MDGIGILVSQLSRGGAERQTALLVSRLAAEHGLRPWVYSLSPQIEPFGESVRRAGCDLMTWNSPRSYQIRRSIDIRRQIRRRGTRLLHAVHYEAAAYGYLATLGMGRVRLLPSIRSTVIRPQPLKAAIYRRMLTSSPRVIANSHSGAEFVRTRFGVAAGHLRVIPNGIDPALCRAAADPGDVRQRLGIGPDTPVVIYVGKQSGHKNVPLLLDIIGRVHASRPDVVFVLVGHRMAAGDLPAGTAGARVLALGLRDDVYDLIAAADLLLLTSRTEGCPNVVLEAMLLGTPPVATSVGDCPRIVRDGSTGLLFPSGDPEAGARQVLRLLESATLREALAAQGAESVRRDFSVERMVADTVAVYREMLDGARA